MAQLPSETSNEYCFSSLYPVSFKSSGGNLTLHSFNTAPSSTASWHGLYKPLDPKVKLQSLLLFSNTLYSNNKSS